MSVFRQRGLSRRAYEKFWRRPQAAMDCPNRRLSPILNAQLLQYSFYVHLYRCFGDVEFGGDCFIRTSVGEPLYDQKLPLGKLYAAGCQWIGPTLIPVISAHKNGKLTWKDFLAQSHKMQRLQQRLGEMSSSRYPSAPLAKLEAS